LFKLGGQVSSSRGFAYAYLGVTAGFVLAWFVAPVEGGRTWIETTVVALLALASLSQAGWLLLASFRGWGKVDEAWDELHAHEEAGKAIQAQ
jgi:hypothetical protein